jgi:hypothetical protein
MLIALFCSRAMGDSSSAVTYFEESVEFLSKLPKDDLEVNSLEPCLSLFDKNNKLQDQATFVCCQLISLNLVILQITHTLSVSLNKIGDLKYYDGDLQAARSYYFKSLNVRRDVIKNNSNVSSQVG